MTEPNHTVRNSLIDRARTFTLEPDALHWSDAGGQGRMAYTDIRDTRLVAHASPTGETLQCHTFDPAAPPPELLGLH